MSGARSPQNIDGVPFETRSEGKREHDPQNGATNPRTNGTQLDKRQL